MNDIPSQIGSYPIERELGRGGMGVVYLGRDTKLDRLVAIKVLPQELSSDPERLARFEREAKLLASLNHPNIAGIYGLEDAEGSKFLVLEYVEGETLGHRLERGQLALDDTLAFCKQMTMALEAAHEKGVIHRDLKPGNVHITPGDEVKVLDFGLAKGAVTTESSSDLPDSPTMTFPATGAGVILGTTAYLSPEQARGKAVNRRADIWAFGCVLFECLTGRQAFEGETVTDTIAKILERDADYSLLPANTPAKLRHLLARCLEKDEKKRLRDIGDARLEIEEIQADRSSSTSITVPVADTAVVAPAAGARGGFARAALFFALGAVVTTAAWMIIGSGSGERIGGGSGSEVSRVSMTMPPELRVQFAELTPDGRTLLFWATERNPGGGEAPTARLYSRALDSFEAKPLAGTDNVNWWWLSPDGQQLAFVTPRSERSQERVLSTIPVDASSPPVVIADYSNTWQWGVWLENGDMVVRGPGGKSIVRIPSGGGEPSEPMPINGGDFGARIQLAEGLPGDRGILVNVISWTSRGYQIGVGLLDPDQVTVKTLFDVGGNAAYSPTGHILFARSSTLLAAPFDLEKLEVTGEPVALLDGIMAQSVWQNGQFWIAKNGTLMYAPGRVAGTDRRVMFVDQDKRITPWSDEGRTFELPPSVSANGRYFASVVTNSKGVYELWGGGLSQKRLRRLAAFADADCQSPVWSPDGSLLAFQRFSSTPDDGVYVVRPGSSAEPRKIVGVKSPESGEAVAPLSWTPDGKSLLVYRLEGGNLDIHLAQISPSDPQLVETVPILTSEANEIGATFSPDGKWIVFESNETGDDEVYACSYDGSGSTGLPIPISSGPGSSPRWSKDGKKVYFARDQQGLMVVDVETSPDFSVSKPRVFLPAEIQETFNQRYETLPGGRLLIVQRGEEEGDITRYNLILNWTKELEERAPGPLALR